MKFAFLTILLLISFAAQIKAQADETSDVKRFRESRDKSFRSPGVSPLTSEDFTKFKGLEYFDVSEKFVVKARFEKTADTQVFMMPTSIGTTRKYFKYGVLKFELDGTNFSLAAFQSENAAPQSRQLFVPFRDLTNGKETYGAGRYLYITAPSGAEAVLDFNFAYNPICAYGSDKFSCPIAPKENSLQIEIKAGEKVFPHSAKK